MQSRFLGKIISEYKLSNKILYINGYGETIELLWKNSKIYIQKIFLINKKSRTFAADFKSI